MRKLVLPLIAGMATFAVVASWAIRPRATPLIAWAADSHAMEIDARALKGEMARMPKAFKPEPAADIVVIVLDTLRADRLGTYGYTLDTTPHLDAWAEDARVYTEMISDGAWTLPSHASLFTGLPAYEHGARGIPLDAPGIASPLKAGSPTIARALHARGYTTVGIAANQAFLDASFGLDQGFDVWFCGQFTRDTRKLPYASGDRVTALAIQALARPRSGPMFLFVNYMDAHGPWLPREGYVREPSAIDRDVLPYSRGWEGVSTDLMAGGRIPDHVRHAWSEAYDSEVRFLDEQVGRLLDKLPSLGIGPEDAVFILSDHGEYLGEHALVEHSKDLYDEVLRVPLLVRAPDIAPGRDATPIQTHDVASMILSVAKVPPLERMMHTDGLQVSELYWSRKRDLRETRYNGRFDRIRRAYRQAGRVLITGGTDEAFDLTADPDQRSSVPDAPWVPALREAAARWMEGRTPAETGGPGQEGDVAALRALGYVE